MIQLIRFPLLSCLTTLHDQPSLIFDIEFSFLPERLTCAPDLPTDNGYKNHTLDPILAAGGCRLTTAEPSRLQRGVVITQ